MPFAYSDGTRFKLGHWVNNQRNNKKMSAERRMRLTKIGFVWNVNETWDAGFNALKQFKAREGHCLVPLAYSDGTRFKLGRWVSRQRMQK